jgi:hypothetical protein
MSGNKALAYMECEADDCAEVIEPNERYYWNKGRRICIECLKVILKRINEKKHNKEKGV